MTKAVISTGQKLVRGGHSASRKIIEHLKELETSVETLKAEAQERRQRLMQSYEAHLFLNEVRMVPERFFFNFFSFLKTTGTYIAEWM